MEKFTTAKNITELETSEEKELRKTDKKRKQEQGEELIQGLKNKRSTEKALIRAEKKRQKQDRQAFIEREKALIRAEKRRQKEAERKAELKSRKRGKEILKHWKRQKEAERKASKKREEQILKS